MINIHRLHSSIVELGIIIDNRNYSIENLTIKLQLNIKKLDYQSATFLHNTQTSSKTKES